MTGTAATGSREDALRQGQALLARDPAAALEQAHAMLAVDRTDPDAHRLAAKALRRMGQRDAADAAELAAIGNSARIARMRAAIEAIGAGRLPDAEAELRRRLDEEPEDAAALRVLAGLAARSGALAEAAALLRRALDLAPGFAEARDALATVLADSHDYDAAMAELERLIAGASGDDRKRWRARRAALLGRLDRHEDALAEYDAMIADDGADAMAWMGRGHALKTLGRGGDSEASYRRAIEFDPTLGEAWWSVANLKTARFSDEDIGQMETLLARELPERSRVNLLFALGSAREKHGDAEAAFAAYEEANRRWRALIGYNPGWVEKRSADIRETVDAALFEGMTGGAPARDPIFVVGMPRAGSTLVEQILASHSAIEGTAELPYMPALALDLLRQSEGASIAEALSALTPDQRTALGERYLAKAAGHRGGGTPHFLDKTPNNWLFVPLILAILPNARIVDVRRAAMACCFSNFKQHFARGQAFAYDLRDLGAYYRTYCETMAHLERVLPGRIHRVSYERLTADPEAEVRGVTAYLGLEFEPAMLEFHRNPRAVRTASAEQVRRPIATGGNEAWRPFAPWLAPLREALGPLAEPEAG